MLCRASGKGLGILRRYKSVSPLRRGRWFYSTCSHHDGGGPVSHKLLYQRVRSPLRLVH